MFLQPTTVKAGIKRHLSFIQLEKDADHHSAYSKPIELNDDTNKLPNLKNNRYYLQRDNAFNTDIYNSHRSYNPINNPDWTPMYVEKLTNRSMNVVYQNTPITDIPRRPKKIYSP